MFYVVEDDAGEFWTISNEDLEMGMTVLFSAKTYLECEAWKNDIQPAD
jgi:hypothetical protein